MTFKDIFPGLSRTKVIFQDFPGRGIFKKKIQDFRGGLGTLQYIYIQLTSGFWTDFINLWNVNGFSCLTFFVLVFF